ncbi:chromate transporter [Anaerorhabdus furcosa]|uniref:Chromate transporter n=1 Tax=Anaerorhabdus furcosa TaxID=118967 RepID=A0A1T4L9V6_9FIRM|nr:chromate transporter [Anaerorhabdus furcosa]SJZ51383.1 chromate transporter [Anaerorhabdus furcosa]
MLLLQLIIEFFKTGLFAIGGGLATIPFLYEMSYKYGWFSIETLTTMIAISESTPGAMGVNMATYVGTHLVGIVGGIITTLSLVAPSIIVICIIAKMLTKFKESKIVQGLFYGLRPAVVALIVVACSSIFITTFFKDGFTLSFAGIEWIHVGVFVVLYALYQWKKPHPILVIVATGILGVLFQL